MKTTRLKACFLAIFALLVLVSSCSSPTTPPAQRTGSIRVTSTPTGARVFLDGTDKGLNTDCTLTNISTGSHSLKLTMTGYTDFLSTVSVTAGQTATVNATMTQAPGALAVTPAGGITSTGAVGGPFTPASQNYTLQNTGGVAIDWTAAATQTWVTVSLASGNLAAGATVVVTVSINAEAGAFASGAYNATVNFTNTTNAGGNATRSVSLTVLGLGVLTVSPAGGLASSGHVGGPFTPASQDYILQNTGGAAISWTAASTQTWVTALPASGDLGVGASTTVTASINGAVANALGAGTYNGTLTFTNTTSGFGSTTRPASLIVTAAGGLTVSPAGGFASTGNVGGPFAPASQIYTLQNTGGVPIDWTAAVTQTWVTVSPAFGNLGAGASTTVTASIDTVVANALAAGTYNDTLTFTNTTNGIGSTTRPVTLTVTVPSNPIMVTIDYERVLPIPNPNGANFPYVAWYIDPTHLGTRALTKVTEDIFTTPLIPLVTERVIRVWVMDTKMDNGTSSKVCRTIKVNGQLLDVGLTIYGEASFIIGNDGIVRMQ